MPIWGKTFTYSAKREQDGHRCLWKDLYINILCLILPIVELLHSTVRGSRTKIQTKPFFTMSMSNQHTIVSWRNSCKAGRAYRGVLIMETVRSGWWRQTGSNRRPEACKATALPTELCPQLEIPPLRCAKALSNHGGPRRT
jgi:hypothetical protein